MELESAMYTNCLILGLEPSIINLPGSGSGSSNTTTSPRVGLFRHSNPKLGEQLLYFILSALRGPAQSAKDFDRVWPIFDSAQSRDFRKVVQGIISELESQGALPRSNSRVSSLATCCGPRFVELLWQLSLHALREVHRRTFPADVASNPLPASLTDVAFSHAASLLPVTKARIALERRRFLKNAETAVQRQAMWSNLAHEMTAEFRGLCAEEAYLQQELEKLHDLRNKVKLEGELWDDLVSSSSQNSHLVAKSTHLWESILSRQSQYEVLASGPIEDLIAHREHRYRISGSSLIAAMEQSTQVPSNDALSVQPGDLSSMSLDDNERTNRPRLSHREKMRGNSQVNDETHSRLEERTGRANATVDVAEVIRRWTHALQRIHKQSLQLAKANDGEGPEILRSTHENGSTGHAESLAATLAEHQQHLASFQVLINQLKEVAPAIQQSITVCEEKVNGISASIPPATQHHGRSSSPIQAQSSGRVLESTTDDVSEVTSKMSSVQLDKTSGSPALKLPQLFSLTPSSSGKGGNMQKRNISAPQIHHGDHSEKKLADQPMSNNKLENAPQENDRSYIHNLKRSVREVALSMQSCSSGVARDSYSDENFGHYPLPLPASNYADRGLDNKIGLSQSRGSFVSQTEAPMLEEHASDGHFRSKLYELSDMLSDPDTPSDFDRVNDYLSGTPPKSTNFDAQRPFLNTEDAEAHDQVISPSCLLDTPGDLYEDLLAPLSQTEAAFMDH